MQWIQIFWNLIMESIDLLIEQYIMLHINALLKRKKIKFFFF